MAPYFDDDGNELNPDLIPMPSLCTVCRKKDDPHEEVLCNLNRLDQADEDEFICHAYEAMDAEQKSKDDEDDIIYF